MASKGVEEQNLWFALTKRFRAAQGRKFVTDYSVLFAQLGRQRTPRLINCRVYPTANRDRCATNAAVVFTQYLGGHVSRFDNDTFVFVPGRRDPCEYHNTRRQKVVYRSWTTLISRDRSWRLTYLRVRAIRSITIHVRRRWVGKIKNFIYQYYGAFAGSASAKNKHYVHFCRRRVDARFTVN